MYASSKLVVLFEPLILTDIGVVEWNPIFAKYDILLGTFYEFAHNLSTSNLTPGLSAWLSVDVYTIEHRPKWLRLYKNTVNNNPTVTTSTIASTIGIEDETAGDGQEQIETENNISSSQPFEGL